MVRLRRRKLRIGSDGSGPRRLGWPLDEKLKLGGMREELGDGDDSRNRYVYEFHETSIWVYGLYSDALHHSTYIYVQGRFKRWTHLIQCDTAVFRPTGPVVTTGMAWKANAFQKSIPATSWAP